MKTNTPDADWQTPPEPDLRWAGIRKGDDSLWHVEILTAPFGRTHCGLDLGGADEPGVERAWTSFVTCRDCLLAQRRAWEEVKNDKPVSTGGIGGISVSNGRGPLELRV